VGTILANSAFYLGV